jgi:malate synthase
LIFSEENYFINYKTEIFSVRLSQLISQHVANWLHHNICTEEQVIGSLKRMAVVVDGQDADDADYQAMAPEFEKSIAFKAAYALIFEGKKQPSNYTEPLLHEMRRKQKVAMDE